MRALAVAALAITLRPVLAAWQTVHNSNFTVAYVQSVNGSLFQLPISDQNVTVEDVEHNIKEIAAAPVNSSLVVDEGGHLLAVWGSAGCGQSPIEISVYKPDTNHWASVGQSNPKTQNWNQDAQIVWLDRSEDQIYIYGGTCNGKTQSGFYRYNLSNNAFEEMQAQGKVMPREMSAAQAVALNDYETLILGGRSGNAWMSMQQIAVWGHGSWTFSSVANSTGIDSRENPLLLPIWKFGQNGTEGTVDQVLVAGGTVAGRAANPPVAILRNSASQGWCWTTPGDAAEIDISYGALTLYSTLAKLSAPHDSGSQSSPKSVAAVTLYNEGAQNKWTATNSVSVSKPAPQAEHSNEHSHSTSTATIAVVSTLLPIIFLCILGIVGWWWWHKRRQRRLFLLPNRQNMLGRQHSANSSVGTPQEWSAPSVRLPVSSSSIPPIPHNEYDSGSIMMMESSEGNRLFMSKQRRNLRVVNPDNVDIAANSSVGSRKSSRAGAQPGPAHDEAHEVLRPETSLESHGSRESSWSSTSSINPFSDRLTERRSEFDFGL